MGSARPCGKCSGRSCCPMRGRGVVGGVMLALGRALGETMAVTFVIGNAHRISSSLLAPGTTISAAIANEFTEAVGELYTASLVELGLILFFVTFLVLAAAQYMLYRLERRAGGALMNQGRYLRRRIAQPDLHGTLSGCDLVRSWLARSHPRHPSLRGFLRHRCRDVHGVDAAARRDGRFAQRHFRQPDDGNVCGRGRHARSGSWPAPISPNTDATARLAFFLRFVNDILLSAPSIVLGLFIYDVMVLPMGHFSAWAGAAALAVIVIPVVVRTTENMLLLIPNTLARSRDRAGRTALARDPDRDLARGASGHRHRRASRDRANLGRDRTAALHLRSTISSGVWIPTSRWRACPSRSSRWR